MARFAPQQPTACLALADGTVFYGTGFGATGQVVADPDDVEIGTKVKPIFRILGKGGEKGIIYYGTKFVPAESSA